MPCSGTTSCALQKVHACATDSRAVWEIKTHRSHSNMIEKEQQRFRKSVSTQHRAPCTSRWLKTCPLRGIGCMQQALFEMSVPKTKPTSLSKIHEHTKRLPKRCTSGLRAARQFSLLYTRSEHLLSAGAADRMRPQLRRVGFDSTESTETVSHYGVP